jgi:hypothetical protein
LIEVVFHYVFIDPETIAEVAHNEAGLGRLVDTLRSMERGCLLAETDLWRLGSELKEKARAISLQNERKLVAELLIHLWKKGPMVVMEGDDGEMALIDFGAANAERDFIDLLLTPSCINPPEGASWEVCSLLNLHASSFSRDRHNLGAGREFSKGSADGHTIFRQCFEKLIRHATEIVIIDYAVGEYYGNDHPSNLRRWVLWMDSHLKNPAEAKLTIRTCGNTSEPAFRGLQRHMRDLQNEVDLKLILDTGLSKEQLPHRRFLISDGSCLDIDRGIDLCDAEGNCREVSITYSKRPRLRP